MKVLLLLIFVATSAYSFTSNYTVSTIPDSIKKEWNAFKLEHKKTYESEEEENKRLQAFLEAKKQVDFHNELYGRGESSFKAGLNKYSDIPHEEFVKRFNGFKDISSYTALTIPDAIKKEWHAFKLEHKKTYESEEEENKRLQAFLEAKKQVDFQNKLYERGESSFKAGLNKYSDIPHEEFVKRFNGFKEPLASDYNSSSIEVFTPEPNQEYPSNFSWIPKGAVTPVKDQRKTCGACWAFAAIGAVEGAYQIKMGELVAMSEQNLIDCSRDYFNQGCSGGYVLAALEYIKYNHGIDPEISYPYQATDGPCRYNASTKVKALKRLGIRELSRGNETALKQAVLKGPVACAMDASLESYQIYTGGIYEDDGCTTYNLDHALLVVGYGVNNDGKKYFILKNSLGTTWGENGYMLLERDAGNRCGIASRCFMPVL